jgi:hypothetical protein
MPDVRRIVPVAPEQAPDPLLHNPNHGDSIVSNHNRWSRTAFEFKDVSSDTWCELSFRIFWHPEEKSRTVHDFAAIGVDFLTEDGSSIEFAYVPGLVRTQIDPHSCYIAGPDYYERSDDLAHSARIQVSFLVPAPAKRLSLTVRSWRNSHPFTIRDLHLHQSVQTISADEQLDPADTTKATPRRTWIALNSTPIWLNYAVVPGHKLFVRGQIVSENPEGHGALARIVFRDVQGIMLPDLYEEVAVSPDVGPFIDIPIHRQTRRFTLELIPPPKAATVSLGFQTWRDETKINLVTPLEVSVGDDLLLENILADDQADARAFLRSALERLERSSDPERPIRSTAKLRQLIDREALSSLVTIHDKLRAVQHGETSAIVDGRLTLCNHEPWPVPETLEWTEDPYQSPAWRLEFQSLSWLLDLARQPESSGLARALDLATSWSRANAWGQPQDSLSAYPLSLATRTEVLLHLLSLGTVRKVSDSGVRQEILLSEAIRHAFALAEILSQNIFTNSILQVRAASALLAVARAVPNFSMAAYWASIAMAQLHNGFDQLIGPEGFWVEQSQHSRLEIISLGLVLVSILEETSENGEFRTHLLDRLKDGLRVIVAITDPAGMLPPFGDVPHGHHHASWLRRLISIHGRSLLSDRKLAEELSYPTGPRMFASKPAGVVTFRHYDHKTHWGYLCASFNEQRHENGHFDCGAFVYAAGGVRWITDPGGSGLLDAGPARQYLLSSRAHNVAIPNGREQSAGSGWIEAQTSFRNGWAVRIGTNVYGPSYSHSRAIICLDDLNTIAVIDKFQATEKRISVEGLLHFGEDIAVALAGANLAIGIRNRNRLRIIPHLIEGRFDGFVIQNGNHSRPGVLQGFLSYETGGLRPANVLSYKFSGSERACGGTILTMNERGLKTIQELLTSQEIRDLLS